MQKTAYSIFYLTLFLIAIGVVMIYSTSAILAQDKFADPAYYLKRELLWLSVGMVALYVGYRVPYNFWARISIGLLLVTAVLLVLVMIPSLGHQVGGARRWLKIGFFGFQPSELAKYAIIMFMARWLSLHQEDIRSFTRGFLPPILVLGMTVGMIIIQPDLGTSVAIGSIGILMLFAGGVRLRYLFSLFLMSLPALYFLVAGAAYRKARILAFLDPWKDPKGVGFQIIQSFIALGSGGLTGVGLGESRQKLFYLPEAHTDFIFSIIGEELGFIGSFVVCTAFIALFILGFRVVLKTSDLTGHLMGLGIVSFLSLQTIVNIAVVTGSMPTKGMPLPFISFGGSSLVLSMWAIGILMNLSVNVREKIPQGAWRLGRKTRKVRPSQRIFIGARQGSSR